MDTANKDNNGNAFRQAPSSRQEPDCEPIENHDRFFRLVNTIPCVLYDYVRWPDGRNQFIYMSPHCERIFGIKAERIIKDASLLWQMVHPEDVERLKQEDRMANMTRTMFQSEARIVLPDGRNKWVQVTSMPSNQKMDSRDIWSGIMLDISERKNAEMARHRLVAKLKKALAEIKTLQGILPICSCCKKIRDDQGNWEAIEVYVSEHSEADFSHSLCPDCAKTLYPDMDPYRD